MAWEKGEDPTEYRAPSHGFEHKTTSARYAEHSLQDGKPSSSPYIPDPVEPEPNGGGQWYLLHVNIAKGRVFWTWQRLKA